MPLGTLDRTPPPFFKQGASAFSKLLLFSAMALFLMVADSRFHMTQPLRAVLATALYPVQWLAMQPVQALRAMGDYFISLESAKSESQEASTKLLSQALRASQVEQLTLENKRLRTLLDLREQLKVEGMAAEVLYDAADPYTRKVIISKGMTSGVALGSPVIDESGVLGQVTELRFMGSNTDVLQGDLLTTSGVDGVYPPGLPVARIDRIERRAETAFARIHCIPLALVSGVRHVVVLTPQSSQIAPRPPEAAPVAPAKKGGKS